MIKPIKHAINMPITMNIVTWRLHLRLSAKIFHGIEQEYSVSLGFFSQKFQETQMLVMLHHAHPPKLLQFHSLDWCSHVETDGEIDKA